MCCLFGLIDYAHRLSARQKTRLLEPLAAACEARGTDATGIAYNSGGKLRIYKRPVPARQLPLSIPRDAYVILGHPRMTTQGNALYNRNNHPFPGHVPGNRFALAHNGVLCNDKTLRTARHLPATEIETDSYVAVQLIEQQKALTPDSLRCMAEAVEGSFTFTVLDQRDNLYLVKGDNPMCLYHYPHLGLYLYASTKPILEQGLRGTWLRRERAVEVPLSAGEILHIAPDGSLRLNSFQMPEPLFSLWGGPSRYWHSPTRTRRSSRQTAYVEDLKHLASVFGYTPEDVEEFLTDGFTPEEIEEVFYHGEL